MLAWIEQGSHLRVGVVFSRLRLAWAHAAWLAKALHSAAHCHLHSFAHPPAAEEPPKDAPAQPCDALQQLLVLESRQQGVDGGRPSGEPRRPSGTRKACSEKLGGQQQEMGYGHCNLRCCCYTADLLAGLPLFAQWWRWAACAITWSTGACPTGWCRR